MSELVRFGVSIDEELLQNFDQLMAERGYENRSEALRDIIRDELVQAKLDHQKKDTQVLGSLTMVYEQHARELTQKMADIQHKHHDLVVSVMHAHISHDDCMKLLMLHGKYGEVKALANDLLSLKGVKHGKLFVSLPASNIDPSKKQQAKHQYKHKHIHNGAKKSSAIRP